MNSLDKNDKYNIRFKACYNFSTLTLFLTRALHFLLDSRVLAVVSDFQTAGPQGSKQPLTVGFVWQVLLTWYLLEMDENIHGYRSNSCINGGRQPETRNLDRREGCRVVLILLSEMPPIQTKMPNQVSASIQVSATIWCFVVFFFFIPATVRNLTDLQVDNS